MRVSTKVEFGIIALVDIAVNSANGEIVTVTSIAKRQNISTKYLEQIITALRQARIVSSQKGAKGGYTISGSYKDINFSRIINALDVNILSDVDFEPSSSDSEYVGLINDVLWKKMVSYLNEYSQSLTLDDVLKVYNEKQLTTSVEPMYYI